MVCLSWWVLALFVLSIGIAIVVGAAGMFYYVFKDWKAPGW